jgi:hypothetical protein
MEGSLVAYKVFTNGSVLNASEVNDNLMNQAVITFSNSTARGSAITTPVEGMLTYLEDTDIYQFWNGTAWTNLTSSPTWTSFTPTWTNLTVGDGTYSSAAYLLDGKLAHVSVALIFGSTTSISGDVQITVPEAIRRKTAVVLSNNTVSLQQTGVSNIVGGLVSNPADDRNFLVRVELSNGTYGSLDGISATIPFTWATGHRIQLAMSYEVL